jgi:hypothetical protein
MMIYSTTDRMRATFIKEMLSDKDILVVLFDKTASPYGEGILQNEIQLYVHFKHAEEAIEFIYNLPE